MRILLVNDHGTPTGGAELQALALRDGLRSRGHEVQLLTSRAVQVPAPVLADVTCFGTTSDRMQVLTRTVNPSAVRQVHRLLRAFRPEVVHLRMFLNQMSPAVLPLLRRVGVVCHVVTYKAVCPRGTKVLPDGATCREPAGLACLRHSCVTPQSWALDMTQLALVRRWQPLVDRTIAPSSAVRRRLEEAGVTGIELVPNAVTERPARPPLAGPPLVGFVGRLVPEKGVDVLLHAFARLRTDVPGLRLLVIGDGPERPRLCELADRLSVGEAVEFPGHLPRAEVERRMDTAWVQAIPGRWEEPFGNVVTEAMMRGTAVVASDLGGPADVVRPGVTGGLVRPGDPLSLAAALLPVLTDRDAAERFGGAGRALALAEHSQSAILARLEGIYGELVRAYRAKDGAVASRVPLPGRPGP